MGRLCLALISLFPLLAQEPKPPVFRSDVKLVRLLTTVKDFHGQLIGGLEKTDFVISDNGVRQDIAVFERYTEQPLSIAVLLDTDICKRRHLPNRRQRLISPCLRFSRAHPL